MTLLKRLIGALGTMPCRALVNVGGYKDQYTDLPANVIVDSWFPQPSVIPQVDVVIHHGGNNSFTECLLFRQAGNHHALCVGRTRQRHARAGDRLWLQT